MYPKTVFVTVIVYGTENGTKYWLLKNSWGRYWERNGYAKVERCQYSWTWILLLLPRLGTCNPYLFSHLIVNTLAERYAVSQGVFFFCLPYRMGSCMEQC